MASEPRSYEEYVVRRFGRGVYELVFEPLARKVWGDPKLLSAELARARIPSGGASELILRLLKLKETTENEDAPFFYYPRGGFGVFPTPPGRGDREGRRTRAHLHHAGGARRATVRASVPCEVQQEGATTRLEAETVVSSIPLQTLSALLLPGRRGRGRGGARSSACATSRSCS